MRPPPPTMRTILQQDGSDHLRLWCNAFPGRQMALITSGLCAPSRAERVLATRAAFDVACGTVGTAEFAPGAMAYSCNPYGQYLL